MVAMKVATYNVNGIKSRLPRLLEWLAREQPDVACLQELKALDDSFPVAEIRQAGYHALWKGQRSWNGVAILSRGSEPVEIRRELPGDTADDHSRYLEAAIDGLLVACLYLPNGNPQPGPKFDYKLAWMERLIAHAAGLFSSGHPVVMAGDYNVVPTDLDIYKPTSWRKDALLQPETRERYQRLLDQGWIDSIRHLHPDAAVYTFWDYFRQHWQRNSGLRIDHLLLNPQLAPALVSAGVDAWVRGQEGASDHAPTWIELDLSKVGRSGRPAQEPPDGKSAARKAPARKAPAKKVPAAKGAARKAATRSPRAS
jgi:exodeoxyribonuclease-3